MQGRPRRRLARAEPVRPTPVPQSGRVTLIESDTAKPPFWAWLPAGTGIAVDILSIRDRNLRDCKVGLPRRMW